MNFISTLITLITMTPRIINLAKEIIKFINSIKDVQERRALIQRMNEAIDTAKSSGDTSELDAIYREYRTRVSS